MMAHENTVPEASSLTRLSTKELAYECTRRAEELVVLLEEEAAALKIFNSATLMELLPRKERLLIELRKLVESLTDEENLGLLADQPRTRLLLKNRLQRVAALNLTNRTFIENTLSYYDDFLNCLCPRGYSRGQEGRPERTQIAMSGIAFKKEI